MKYIHLYDDNNYCMSDSFKGTPNTLELTDYEYENLGNKFEFKDGELVEVTE